jgi:anaerobic magnesium-protoporphyrin IX monomethyl ester cyclase
MKVFLLNPTNTRGGTRIPDIGLAYIANSLRNDGHTVDIMQGEKSDLSDIRGRLETFRPDVIGIKVFSVEINAASRAIQMIRSILPASAIVLGGPHISIAPPEEALNYFTEVDYLIRGEGEFALPKLLRLLADGSDAFESVEGLVFRKNGSVMVNQAAVYENLDALDYPAWDLVDPRNYKDGWYFWSPEYPRAPFLTSRGCPYRCAFCAQNVVGGKILRRRSLDHVFSELELLQKTYGVYNFDFIDDNFLMNREYVQRFCEGVLERGWKIRWNCCGARLDFLDLNLVKLMDKAGCNIISVGFESGTQRVLNYMKKDLDLYFVRKQVSMITENTSIRVMGLFIVGYPTETETEIRNTIRLARELPIFMANFSTYLVLPGCEETEKLIASGEVERIPWDKLGLDNHEYAPKGLTLKRLQYLYVLAYFKFYSRPHILFGILRYSWRRLPWFISHVFHKLTWKERA